MFWVFCGGGFVLKQRQLVCLPSLGIMINSLITEAVLGRAGGVSMKEGGREGETMRRTGRR